MNKDIIDQRLMGRKAYFTSKNLRRPTIIYEDLKLLNCFEKYGFDGDYEVFHNHFMIKGKGKVLYFEFNKKRNLGL